MPDKGFSGGLELLLCPHYGGGIAEDELFYQAGRYEGDARIEYFFLDH